MIPKDSKDLPGFRAFLQNQRTQACSSASVFTGPLKAAMEKMVQDIDAWLTKLPTDEAKDTWCLDHQLDSLFNLLTQAAAAASLSALELSKVTNGNSSEQLATALTAEISKRVTAGELFTKESLQTATTAAAAAQVKAQLDAGEFVPKKSVEQLCSESRISGFGEGEKKVRDELAAEAAATKLIGERKALVQAASLPLPDVEIERVILGGTDEQFNARLAAFKTRQEALKTEGFQLNADGALANLWLDDNAYKGFEKMVKSLPQLKFNANPLATVPGNEQKPAAPILIV